MNFVSEIEQCRVLSKKLEGSRSPIRIQSVYCRETDWDIAGIRVDVRISHIPGVNRMVSTARQETETKQKRIVARDLTIAHDFGL
jgi:hypothetical protein